MNNITFCEYPWTNIGDLTFFDNKECFINFEIVKILWGIGSFFTIINMITCLLALVNLKRSTKSKYRLEFLVLLNLLFSFLFLTITGLLQTFFSFEPGQRSIGRDLMTTIFYSIGNILSAFHAFTLPLFKTGSSLIPFSTTTFFMLEKTNYYYLLLFILFIFVLIAYVLLIQFAILASIVIISISWSLICISFTLNSIFILIISRRMTKNLLKLNIDGLSETQKKGYELTLQVSKKNSNLAFIGIFLNFPIPLACAISPLLVSSKISWVYLPITNIIHSLALFRAPYSSYLFSKSLISNDNNNNINILNTVHNNNNNTTTSSSLIAKRIHKEQLKYKKLQEKKKLLSAVLEEKTSDFKSSFIS